MNKTSKKIFLATLLTTLGFLVALAINVPGQSVLELTLNNIGVAFLGIASLIGWMWLITKCRTD